MDQPIDVADCLRRWQAGDESAAEELIRHLYPMIAKIVRMNLPRRDDEKDLVQEILMKTFSKLHQFRGDAPMTHWVSRLALTTCLDRLRAQRIRPEIRRTDLTPEELEMVDASWLDGKTADASSSIQARDLVDKLLSTLSPADRNLILLVDLEGHSLEEISQLTGWGISKIKMRLFRIRGHLRNQMERLEHQS
ncbi:MAG: RNA polymerase sigma factor [Methylacidiphilales bacterium]|nr:RNA polymerase sigma factor [Candidatus Methylacidiphilales bacterium]